MTHLETEALEQGAYTVTVAFTDEDGAAVTPNSIVWALTDDQGRTINSRSAVTATAPAASYNIILSGSDLAIPRAGELDRIVTVEATYDSSYGTSLPFKDEITFKVHPLTNV